MQRVTKNKDIADRILDEYGTGLEDHQLEQIAKEYNLRPGIFIRNYRIREKVRKIFND